MANEAFNELVEVEERHRAVADAAGLPAPASADQAWLRRFFRAAARVRVEPVPADLRRVLDDRFEQWRTLRAPEPVLRRILAVLTSEILPGAAIAGARGVTAARHLVFSAESADVSVHVRTERGRVTLDGMVLRADGDDAACAVRLVRDGVVAEEVTTDGFGSFRIDGVDPARYVVVVGFDDVELETEPFDVTTAAG